jgi:hypothetical protein
LPKETTNFRREENGVEPIAEIPRQKNDSTDAEAICEADDFQQLPNTPAPNGSDNPELGDSWSLYLGLRVAAPAGLCSPQKL